MRPTLNYPKFTISGLRRWLLLIFSIITIVFLVTSCREQTTAPPTGGQSPPPPSGSIPQNLPPVTPVTVKGDPSKFTHKSHEKRPDGSPMACEACHRQTEVQNPAKGEATFPGHSSCITCHLTEFTTTNAGAQGMCIICHKDVKSQEAPRNGFPGRKSFNVFFDPAQHKNHVAYTYPSETTKKLDCATCHKTQDSGVTVGFPNHPECYQCHTPQGVKSPTSGTPHQVKPGAMGPGDCESCHKTTTEPIVALKTLMVGKAFNYKFTHKVHEKAAKCEECHNLDGKYNTDQVSSPLVKAHTTGTSAGKGCFSCHNDKRAFGDKDFGKCGRCHGAGFNPQKSATPPF